jgi:hypothetical protein
MLGPTMMILIFNSPNQPFCDSTGGNSTNLITDFGLANAGE